MLLPLKWCCKIASPLESDLVCVGGEVFYFCVLELILVIVFHIWQSFQLFLFMFLLTFFVGISFLLTAVPFST